jgi:hypothetical protein
VDMLDHFAEALSRHDARRGKPGGDVAQAAATLGQSPAWGRRMLRQLQERLGSQAV